MATSPYPHHPQGPLKPRPAFCMIASRVVNLSAGDRTFLNTTNGCKTILPSWVSATIQQTNASSLTQTVVFSIFGSQRTRGWAKIAIRAIHIMSLCAHVCASRSQPTHVLLAFAAMHRNVCNFCGPRLPRHWHVASSCSCSGSQVQTSFWTRGSLLASRWLWRNCRPLIGGLTKSGDECYPGDDSGMS